MQIKIRDVGSVFATLAKFHCDKNSFTRMFKEVRDDAEGFSNAWFAKRTEGRRDGKKQQLLILQTVNQKTTQRTSHAHRTVSSY